MGKPVFGGRRFETIRKSREVLLPRCVRKLINFRRKRLECLHAVNAMERRERKGKDFRCLVQAVYGFRSKKETLKIRCLVLLCNVEGSGPTEYLVEKRSGLGAVYVFKGLEICKLKQRFR